MNLLKITRTPLTQEEITDHLRLLRQHSLIESSHFAVSTVLELKLKDGVFAYVSGVNVENAEHNRLGMHAEQNAIAAAQSLFGGNIKFSKAWLMGAPDTLSKGSDHFLADNLITSCGHCRQILLSFSTPETQIFSVSVNGAVGDAMTFPTLLPSAFSERDLETTAEVAPPEPPAMVRHGFFEDASPLMMPGRHLTSSEALLPHQIRAACAEVTPHLVDRRFRTSPIDVCMLKISREDSLHYFTGVLVQDIAFLSTDAVFSSLGQAITEFGGHHLRLEEVNLYGESLSPDQLSSTELQHLARFSTAETRIKFHTRDASSEVLTIADCVNANARKLLASLPLGAVPVEHVSVVPAC